MILYEMLQKLDMWFESKILKNWDIEIGSVKKGLLQNFQFYKKMCFF